MEIIFQIGDFLNSGNSVLDYLMNFLSQILSAIIGAGVVVWIFYSETKRDKTISNELKLNAAKDNVFYFRNLLKYAIDEQEKQNQTINEYISRMSSALTEQFEPMEQKPLSNIYRLSKILDGSTFFHSFMTILKGNKEDKIDSYRKISAGIDYLVKGNRQIIEILEMATPNDYKRSGYANKNYSLS